MWRSEMQALREALQLAGTVLLMGMAIGMVGVTAHIKHSASLPSGNSSTWSESFHLLMSCTSPANAFDQPLWFNIECGE